MRVSVPTLARRYDRAQLAALVGKEIIGAGWEEDGSFTVQFAVNLSQQEKAAVQITLLSPDDNAAVMGSRAWQAVDALRAVRDSGHDTVLSPLQTSRAVRLFARVLLYLLRLQLGRTDELEVEPPTNGPAVVDPAPSQPSKGR